MLKTSRLIDVENTEIDEVDLNITATNRPVGSHTMLLGWPPISRCPFRTVLKSAIGNDCFGITPTEIHKKNIKSRIYFKTLFEN